MEYNEIASTNCAFLSDQKMVSTFWTDEPKKIASPPYYTVVRFDTTAPVARQNPQ